jgi:hypothetical protein
MQPVDWETKAPSLAQLPHEPLPPYANDEPKHAEHIAVLSELEFSGPACPGGHGMPAHAVAVAEFDHWPDEQGEQRVAPASEKEPGAQAKQAALPPLVDPAGP